MMSMSSELTFAADETRFLYYSLLRNHLATNALCAKIAFSFLSPSASAAILMEAIPYLFIASP